MDIVGYMLMRGEYLRVSTGGHIYSSGEECPGIFVKKLPFFL